MTKPTDFPAALRRHLAARGWSQLDLVRAAGVSQAVVSDWLAGKREPGLASLVKVADALKVKLDALRH